MYLTQQILQQYVFNFLTLSIFLINNKNLWSCRKLGRNLFGCYVSVDGIDQAFREPQQLDHKWRIYKINGAGLRYEVGFSLDTGDIVWVYGPFHRDSSPNTSIFRKFLNFNLSQGENLIPDRGYTDHMCIINDNILSPVPADMHSHLRARHTTANTRLNQIIVLSFKFRHQLSFDGQCYHAVARVTQLAFRDEPLLYI